jgi:hypothetical protein
MTSSFIAHYGEAVKTAFGFFWKAAGGDQRQVLGLAPGPLCCRHHVSFYRATALILHYAFALLGITPESAQAVANLAQFKFDYTFWLNLVFMTVSGWLVLLHRGHHKAHTEEGMDHGGKLTLKRVVVYLFSVALAGGLVAYAMTGGTG